ncbi:hypothetical protein [Pseudonocardia sp. TRM90224]|uniref:hypothetical protein n=1 Tax=Pseudonocardia sp. TRM90224 TaxID=2812678 RepID=UPI001E41F0A1|nr:hypothetical protein [Pseudonocardia sp. TRM90224]
MICRDRAGADAEAPALECPRRSRSPTAGACGRRADLAETAAEVQVERIENSALVIRTKDRYERVRCLKAHGKGIETTMREFGLAKEAVRRLCRAITQSSGTQGSTHRFMDHAPFRTIHDHRRPHRPGFIVKMRRVHDLYDPARGRPVVLQATTSLIGRRRLLFSRVRDFSVRSVDTHRVDAP